MSMHQRSRLMTQLLNKQVRARHVFRVPEKQGLTGDSGEMFTSRLRFIWPFGRPQKVACASTGGRAIKSTCHDDAHTRNGGSITMSVKSDGISETGIRAAQQDTLQYRSLCPPPCSLFSLRWPLWSPPRRWLRPPL